jgi:hypothetical protein
MRRAVLRGLKIKTQKWGPIGIPIVLVVSALLLSFVCPVWAGCPGKDEQIGSFEKRIRTLLAEGKIPIIDVEYHHGPGVPVESLIEGMNRNGVALT